MKKALLCASGMFLFLLGCSSSDDAAPAPVVTPSFTFDNQTYSVIPSSGINELRQQTTFNDVVYDRSSITVVGMIGFAQTATMSFDLYYRHGESIAGTYPIYDSETSDAGFDDYITPLSRACLGWTSLGNVFMTSGADPVNANNPHGTVTVTANSPTNYTIHFVGDFKIYDDNFEVVRNVPCSMNVTGPVVVHN